MAERGLFVVIDGLDGIGKGEIERAIITYEQKLGKAVFDSVAFSKANRKGLPELRDFWNPPETHYHTVITAEPTYEGIGHNIRFEITARNERDYSAETEIQAYSLNRLILMKRVVIPAISNGLNVVQSRCFSATLAYQTLRAEDEGRNPENTRHRILVHEGNKLQLEYHPDLLIIPRIKNIDELMKRIEARKDSTKDDNSIFDNSQFQKRLNRVYQSSWLRKLFESAGTTVEYLDASISPESTRKQALEIYRNFLSSKQRPR